jgi:fructokinase
VSDKLYGAIEAGGTKFVCLVGSGPQDVQARARIDTTTPAETLGRVTDFFKRELSKSRIAAIGIGSFGPLDLDPASPTCGYITSTPKPGWAQTDLAGIIRNTLQLPVRIDTDVNAAALAEGQWGAARTLKDYVYVTVGTGIGGGAVVGGKLVHGLVHPEMGHILVRHDIRQDPYPGSCPFHADCLEGMASGPSIQKRWGKPAPELPVDHPAWELEAAYLAQGILSMIYILSPRRIILGGGVLKQSQLLPLVRRQVLKLLNSYIVSPPITQLIDEYIVSPGLGDLAGVMGALALAMQNRPVLP